MPDPNVCFAVLAQIDTLVIDGFRIRNTTNNPCHLTAYWTDVPPRRHHASRRIRGKLVPWGVYFCFVSWHPIEQIEPGDTLVHTFNFTPWDPCQTRWFTFRGTVLLQESPSVSAIFEMHYPGSYLFIKNPSFELWPYPEQLPPWWLWTAPDPGNVTIFRDEVDRTHGSYSCFLYANGSIPWRRLYQDVDAIPYRGLWIHIRPDMKGAPINQTGFFISIDGTPPYSANFGPASPDYWAHVDITRKIPANATKIHVECRVDFNLGIPNWCRFDNIRSCAPEF